MDVQEIRREYSSYLYEATAAGATAMSYEIWLEFRLRDARNNLAMEQNTRLEWLMTSVEAIDLLERAGYTRQTEQAH